MGTVFASASLVMTVALGIVGAVAMLWGAVTAGMGSRARREDETYRGVLILECGFLALFAATSMTAITDVLSGAIPVLEGWLGEEGFAQVMAYATLVLAAVLILTGFVLVVRLVAWGVTKVLVQPASRAED
ncbi:hypothetical protein ACPW96_18240 [Micromonospora sp. DT81.3]|uniref:hypothetical protein n=1 Tax=Micromonospora sp. DT81.3 TaxID=3416523 RepID=UPI003CF612E8